MDHQLDSGQFHSLLAGSMFPDVNWNTQVPWTPRVVPVTPHLGQHHQDTRQPTGSQSPAEATPRPQQEVQDDSFKAWLSSRGVSATTIVTLTCHGFTSERLFKTMLSEDIMDMNIQPLGQRRLLQSLLYPPKIATSAIPPTETVKPSTEANSPELSVDPTSMALQTIMKMLTAGGKRTSMDYLLQPTKNRGDLDMPVFVTGQVKYLDIVDFVRAFDSAYERVIAGDAEHEQLIIRTGQLKPKLENISPLQWMGASIRIMRELLAKGQLKNTDIDYYLGYMEKIGDLASKYTWQSLLVYDREYRRWQAQSSCQWGTDNIHLVEVHLDVRNRTTTNAATRSRSGVVKPDPASRTNEICRQYNTGRCLWGKQCKFSHTCSADGCHESHPQIDHPRSPPKNMQQRD